MVTHIKEVNTVKILNIIHNNDDVYLVSDAKNDFGDDKCGFLWWNGFIGSDGKEIWLTDKAFKLLSEQEII